MRTIINKTNAMKRIEKQYNISIEELLRSLYVDKNMSIPQIAEELILSVGTIFNWLEQAKISTRKLSWRVELFNTQERPTPEVEHE